MKDRRALLLLVLLAATAGGFWWWRTHRGPGDSPATSTVTQPQGGATPRAAAPQAGDAIRPAHLAITVTDARGPIADAAIRIAPHDGDAEVIIAKTGKDGMARVDVAGGAWSISASAAEHAPASVERTVSADETQAIALELTAGGHALSGTITDASGGPVAGARVDAAKLGAMARPDAAIAIAVTGADGKYKLTVADGQLLVAASHADYAPQARYVDVGATGAVADFSLVPGGVIEGIVRDEATKQPVAAHVIALRDGGGRIGLAEASRRAITTGADGKFTIGGLRPGAFELSARAGNLVSRAATRVGLGVAEQIGDVEILVGAMPVVRGKVVGDTGAAVANVEITAFGNGPGESREATSGADGSFTMIGLPPGRWMLMGKSDVALPAGATPVELAAHDVDGVVVNVRTAGKAVGHVEPRQICDVRFDLDGSALRSGLMPMLVRPTSAKEDGSFELSPITPGKGTIVARCPGGEQGSLAVVIAAGMPEIVVKLTPGASIAGKVSDADGKPVGGASVMATAETGTEHMVVVNGMVTSGIQGITNASGAYELRGLTAGTYRIGVLDRGKPMQLRTKPEAAKVMLAATENKTGVDLAVDLPNGKISGTVTSADGKPVADAWVSVHQNLTDMMDEMGGPRGKGPDGEGESLSMTIEANDDDGGGLGTASAVAPVLTDARGHFDITGLAHGKYAVIAEAQAGRLRGRAADVKPDATIAITVLGLSTLRGTVHAGMPITLFSVDLDGPTQATRSFANADGTFELGRVDPGNYVVRVTSTAGNGEAPVTVTANQPATVDLMLVANAILIGKVVDATGAAVGGIGVAVVPDSGDGHGQLTLEGPPPTSGPDGRFRIETKAGKVMLLLLTGAKPTMKPGIVLEAGKTFDAGSVTLGVMPPRPKP